jgi:hypothetical protein
MKNQFRKARNHSSSAYERIKETDVSKIASMVAMLKRALRNKLEVDYVLMDSWFTCWEVVSLIIKRKGLHLIGMYKGNYSLRVQTIQFRDIPVVFQVFGQPVLKEQCLSFFMMLYEVIIVNRISFFNFF